ncbi:MAG: TetR/AcrR family transcriptional regulator [Oscillospiraceae bacterium]|nr:TetR/AcrR family transcriptional regulator [Oscillospiraceae bacterium]
MQDLSGHKIMSMDVEKRDRIINAALVEFNKGYKVANTENIVKKAGISKGLLFHYFESKKKLFEFLLAYATDIVKKEYFELINFEQRDILERLWQTILLKIDLSYKYPMVFDFLTTAHQEKTCDGFLNAYSNTFKEIMSKFFANIDESLFKDGVEPQKAVNVIYWTQLGYSNTQLNTIKSTNLEDYQKEYERFLSEIQEYFDLFRKAFYK